MQEWGEEKMMFQEYWCRFDGRNKKEKKRERERERTWIRKDATFFLKKSLSSRVSVSALAMTGTMLTTLLRRLMNSTSRGRRLETERKSRRQTSKPNEVVCHTNLQQGAVVQPTLPVREATGPALTVYVKFLSMWEGPNYSNMCKQLDDEVDRTYGWFWQLTASLQRWTSS